MIGEFQFEDGGRTYVCRVEQPRAGRTEAWWWFGVSGDQQRYAPFQAKKGDTRDAIKTRVVAYYAELLARRAAPPVPRHHWARRGQTTAPAVATTGEAPAAAPAAAPAPSKK